MQSHDPANASFVIPLRSNGDLVEIIFDFTVQGGVTLSGGLTGKFAHLLVLVPLAVTALHTANKRLGRRRSEEHLA